MFKSCLKDEPPVALRRERCTFGTLMDEVAKESNMDWAAVEEMMPIFEAANLIMYRDGVVYFI